MLFRKKIKRSCIYCIHGTKFTDDTILCVKHGVVSVYYGCNKFKYDPCKRIPPNAAIPDYEKYDQEDFSL